MLFGQRTLADESLFSTVLRPKPLDVHRFYDKAKRERIFFSLLDVCLKLSDFWSTHGPVMSTAASLGSGNVMRRLVEMGAEF